MNEMTETQTAGATLDAALRGHPCFDAWLAAAHGFAATMPEDARAGLAWAALKSLDERHAVDVVQVALPAAGPPMPPFTTPMDDAAWWAGIASRDERRAYASAAFRALGRGDRQAFLRWAQGSKR